jgi:hypothetical protein
MRLLVRIRRPGTVAITVPVANIFLMRAAWFRARCAGSDVPPAWPAARPRSSAIRDDLPWPDADPKTPE